MGPTTGSTRPGAAPRGAERESGSLAGAAAARSDARLAVFLLSRHCEDHGGRPRDHTDQWPDRPIGWRRSPLEFRCLRVTIAPVGLRRERLRRDTPRSLGVGREATGDQLHDLGSVPGFRSAGLPTDHRTARELLSQGHDTVRSRRFPRPLVSTPGGRRSPRRREPGPCRPGETAKAFRAEGGVAHEHAGAGQARRGGGRPVPDPQ